MFPLMNHTVEVTFTMVARPYAASVRVPVFVVPDCRNVSVVMLIVRVPEPLFAITIVVPIGNGTLLLAGMVTLLAV